MLFNSIDFLIFFPIVVIIYYIIPAKLKVFWLLMSSYYFYMCWNIKYSLLILASTIITFFTGIAIRRFRKYRNIILIFSLITNLLILVYFKYSNYFIYIIDTIFGFIGVPIRIPQMDILLPVGISFYTFQALGYTVDVYRGDIEPENNFIKYALFVSFFPQLVAGPIERSKNLLPQLNCEKRFDYEKARDGFLIMLWGYFLKLVIADRAAVYVDCVYGDYVNYPGYYIVVATVLFGFQIYCDFAGYSAIAIGAAKILGVELMENFDSPYLSLSVADFWRKWHISLTGWFRDYLYIPLGGSRKGKVRKYINVFIVFLVSGLWHGASVTFVIWGVINAIYQIIGELLTPFKKYIVYYFRVDSNSLGIKLIRVLLTFILVDFSWVFFRANYTLEAINIIKSMFFTHNPWVLVDGSLYNCGLSAGNFHVLIMAVFVLFIADLCKAKEIRIRDILVKQAFPIRVIMIDMIILIILIWGMWGSVYNTESFIYFQF